MPDFLVFQLIATIGAMGEFGGHDRRGSLDLPGRSAVIGTLGAALGRRRNESFEDLDGLGVAVASFALTTPLRDYHTVQTVPSAAIKQPQSRPQALRDAGRKVNTTLTSRDYRTDCVFGVALWNGDLSQLEAALRRPVFQTFLGRKACPLSAPFDPQQVGAKTPSHALAHLRLPPWIGPRSMSKIAADEGTELGAPARIETRHDRALNRPLWHFGSRRYAIAHPDIQTSEVTS
ncbi:type I-E CRISPR-associated protein Cas5/CasD [Ponticoccus sp. (in: a-proteobacteria)]|uniref:type I-E CRISPR-associated protein Cas5/CasD n=1 Tax=Ponticoccus sp. (in: a-proteobacteria) TaxID=1925025 RepID=UPI003AB166C2